MKKNILLLVEPDFHRKHVGVRRDICYYWNTLTAEGHEVTLATIINGQAALAKPDALAVFFEHECSTDKIYLPDWRSGASPVTTLVTKIHSKANPPPNFSWQMTKSFSIAQFD